MEYFKIIVRNSRRHFIRSLLTALGIAIALFAFVMIRTLIGSFYSGVEASAKNRLITRNAVSLVFFLPIFYQNTIEQVPGVEKTGRGIWFGGIYKDDPYKTQQFAVDMQYLDMYPELLMSTEVRKAWETDRKGILIGRKVADMYNVKVGDVMQLEGTVFPGLWEFTVKGIFEPKESKTDTRLMFFHWDYLNERNKEEIKRFPDHAGFFVVQLKPGYNPAEVSRNIDAKFSNSFAETLTETESAFVQNFISMLGTIIAAMNFISGIVIVIMLLVLANTMLMGFRERAREYSIYKALGFSNKTLGFLIFSESMFLTLMGCAILGLMLSPFFIFAPESFLGDLISFFPEFRVYPKNLFLAGGLAFLVASIASVFPIYKVSHTKVSQSLRQII